jgi:hypothetical protein
MGQHPDFKMISLVELIEEYIKSLKAMIYEGLMTPESLYSSESSNRSTAQVQLTDPQTGHVLFIEFCREFLKGWVERTLINPHLEKNGYKEGDVYLSFMTGDPNLDTNYLETDDDGVIEENNTLKNKDGSTAITTDPNPYQTKKKKQQKEDE